MRNENYKDFPDSNQWDWLYKLPGFNVLNRFLRTSDYGKWLKENKGEENEYTKNNKRDRPILFYVAIANKLVE